MNPPDQYKALLITRNNVISVFSISIKNLIDKSSLQDSVEEYRDHVMNFLTILEHVIYFRAKGDGFVFSEKISQHPWKLFSSHCRSIAHNSIDTIKQLDNLANDYARMRAVFRMGLMEKRLHEYFSTAFSDNKTNCKFYSTYSIILSGEMPAIINQLSGLSIIDFRFDLKVNLNHMGFYPIDYGIYLMCETSSIKGLDGINERRSSLDSGDGVSLQEKYEILLNKSKVDSEQKGYLEEIVANRDSKILALERRNEIVCSEIKSLEESVTDFQIQLTLLHEQYSKEIETRGGNAAVLTVPSVKSVTGSRADFLSSRHPLTKQMSQIDASISNDINKDNQYTSPLPQLAPFSFSDSVQDCYTKLSKMAASTGDLRSKASSFSQSKDSLDNNLGKFIIGKQLISDTTQRFYSPKNDVNRKYFTKDNDNQTTNYENSNSDALTRLFDRQLDEQRARIMESQQLRKIMGQACRSPRIKAHQRSAQFVNLPKSQSFNHCDSYYVDEISEFDNSSNRSNSFDEYNNISPNSRIIITHSPDDEINYYHLSTDAGGFDPLSDDDYTFDVQSSRVREMIHLGDPANTEVSNPLRLFPPITSLHQLPIVTDNEVPENVEPMMRHMADYDTTDNFINGDRGSGRSRHSEDEQ